LFEVPKKKQSGFLKAKTIDEFYKYLKLLTDQSRAKDIDFKYKQCTPDLWNKLVNARKKLETVRLGTNYTIILQGEFRVRNRVDYNEIELSENRITELLKDFDKDRSIISKLSNAADVFEKNYGINNRDPRTIEKNEFYCARPTRLSGKITDISTLDIDEYYHSWKY
jgi:hypothetical protein